MITFTMKAAVICVTLVVYTVSVEAGSMESPVSANSRSLRESPCTDPQQAITECLEGSSLGPKLGSAMQACSAGPYKAEIRNSILYFIRTFSQIPGPQDLLGLLYGLGLTVGSELLGICPPPFLLTLGFGLRYGGEAEV